jgi:regulatory protein
VKRRECAEAHEAAEVEAAAEVAVARLEGLGGERTEAPVARFGAAFPDAPGHPSADLTGLAGAEPEAGPAQVAAFDTAPARGSAPEAAVALFDTERLTPLRQDIRVAELEAGGRRRGSRREAGQRSGADLEGEEARRGARAPHGGTAGRAAEPRTAERSDGHSAPDAPAVEAAGEEERGSRGRSRRGPQELDPDVDPVALAKDICLRLLTDRARTRQELGQALRRKGIPDEAAGVVLERFDEVGLIDDAAFAGQWVRSRHAYRGLARRAIAFELRRKGVSEEDAGEALAEVDAESEERRARELVDRKLRSLTVATADQRTAAARRLVGMLARKGYGAGVAYRVVKEALAEHGAEAEEFGAEPVEE